MSFGCGSDSDAFGMFVNFAPNSCFNCGGGYWASNASYSVRNKSTGAVEAGELTLVENDYGGTPIWELMTSVPEPGEYSVTITASDLDSRCTASGEFSVPPTYVEIFVGCGEPVRKPEDIEVPMNVIFIEGSVEPL